MTRPAAAAPPVWTRRTRGQHVARLAARLAVALVLVWAARGMGVRWEWVADSPVQLADLFVRMIPPDWAFAGALFHPLAQTVNIATLGTAAAVLLALPVAFLAALNTTFNRGTYLLARLLIVVSRSVDSLIWALIFIIIVGPGSLAGALAVGVRSLGFVAKLFAEAIEEIDRGQVEAVTATGAARFHVLVYGIVPQIRPVFWRLRVPLGHQYPRVDGARHRGGGRHRLRAERGHPGARVGAGQPYLIGDPGRRRPVRGGLGLDPAPPRMRPRNLPPRGDGPRRRRRGQQGIAGRAFAAMA